jgi:hypothetical protein
MAVQGIDPYPAPVHIVTVVNLQVIVKSSVTQSTFTVLFWAPTNRSKARPIGILRTRGTP